MENTLFEITFKIRDPLVIDTDPTNDAITVECIIIDMPFYLYQGLLGTILPSNVALQEVLTTTSQTIESVQTAKNRIEIHLTSGSITPKKDYKIIINNFPTPPRAVTEDYRSQIGLRLSNVATVTTTPLFVSNRNYYNFNNPVTEENIIKAPIHNKENIKGTVIGKETRDLHD